MANQNEIVIYRPNAKSSVSSILEHTAQDGKPHQTDKLVKLLNSVTLRHDKEEYRY